jgi:membrane protein required for colicin V production
MNSFDIAVVVVTLALALLGFRAGLLRSLADILGFVIAAPLALALTPYFVAATGGASGSQMGPGSPTFFILLIVGGILFAQLLRFSVAGLVGDDIHLFDRVAGFFLGAVRALLVAVTLVLVFDRIIPSGRDPGFLKGSKSRPLLSWAAQRGLKSLPPEIVERIDRLKRQRGL